LPQRFLGVHAVRDLDQETNHPRCAAIRIPLRHTAAVENPTPAAIFVPEPIFSFVKLFAARK